MELQSKQSNGFFNWAIFATGAGLGLVGNLVTSMVRGVVSAVTSKIKG